MRPRSQRGATTIYLLFFTLLFFGFLVMATDFGRLYLIQAELQTGADAAALAAATRLVGTSTAAVNADAQMTASFDSTTGNDNRFNLRLNPIGVSGGTGLVTETVIDYFLTLADALANVNGGQTGSIDWGTGLYPKYARVQITAQAPVTFVPLLGSTLNTQPSITVAAVAGLSAPICSACGIDGLAVVDQSEGEDTINFGFTPGQFYTLYLTPAQQTPNAPATPMTLPGTESIVPYVILYHIPVGLQGLDLDGALFEIGAGGLSNSPGLDPPGIITIGLSETAYPELAGNTAAGASTGQDILCGLNTRFGVDPSLNNCGTAAGGEFLELAVLFGSDTDLAAETADTTGLQDYSTEYIGNLRRILTVPVVDAADTLTVLNFRQFLIERSTTVSEGLDTSLVSGAFRAQYLGAPVPLRCGAAGGACLVTQGIGRVVLH
jgi:Flp pilus assembly protein TadG